MVNPLSASQEMRMLRKSLEELDEKTIASAPGMQGIAHRLNKSLLASLHPDVEKAFNANKRHFGSVRAALKVAGLTCGKREPPYFEWTMESVIEAICNLGNQGRNLDSIHRDEPSLYAAGKRFFGTWTQARSQAGFPKEASEFYSADEVQLRMIELYKKGLPLIHSSHRDPKLVRSAKKHFKNWRNAAKLLGLESEVRRK